MSEQKSLPEITMDASNLYREEVYTDQQAGTLRRMIPVTAEGDPDANRTDIYMGQAKIMTPMGAVPLSFEIEASNLAEAAQGFGDAAQIAIEQTAREIEELRRQQESQIVMPQSGAGGIPGGGKIQMP